MHLTCLGLINLLFIFFSIIWLNSCFSSLFRLIHGCLTKSSSRLCQTSEESSMLVRYLRLKTKRKEKEKPYGLL